MPKYRPRATMKYTKNTRAQTRTAGRRYLHGCYHDLVLQGHTGGCFRRVSLFAVLAGNVPKTGTRARATPPPLLRCRPFLRRETAKGVRSHTGRFFRRGAFCCAGGLAHYARAHTQAERGRTARRCRAHALPRPHGRRRIVPCYGKPHSGHRSAHSGT